MELEHASRTVLASEIDQLKQRQEEIQLQSLQVSKKLTGATKTYDQVPEPIWAKVKNSMSTYNFGELYDGYGRVESLASVRTNHFLVAYLAGLALNTAVIGLKDVAGNNREAYGGVQLMGVSLDLETELDPPSVAVSTAFRSYADQAHSIASTINEGVDEEVNELRLYGGSRFDADVARSALLRRAILNNCRDLDGTFLFSASQFRALE